MPIRPSNKGPLARIEAGHQTKPGQVKRGQDINFKYYRKRKSARKLKKTID
jgi:hypothetical protein